MTRSIRHRRITPVAQSTAAAAYHDQAVLIELNTPGGFLDSTDEITHKI